MEFNTKEVRSNLAKIANYLYDLECDIEEGNKPSRRTAENMLAWEVGALVENAEGLKMRLMENDE